ncbi:MAG: membrane protein insertion efficiency factor YidD [Thermoleophilia bacterium]|nr:membrane protein insertion efficiency factor YidD [Thermoleophilia bacterium]
MIRRLQTVSRETVLLPVHAWRLVSRLLPPRCRYYPSCSQYCLDAVRQRGVLTGLLLAAWRVLRCNPWSLGGVDPVPQHGLRRSTGECGQTGRAEQHR